MLACPASASSASRAPGAGSMSSTSVSKKMSNSSRPVGDVEVLVLARPEDVLEQGEAVEPHLQPVSAEKPLEAVHEHRQHLVHVHHHQRAAGSRRSAWISGGRTIWSSGRLRYQLARV